MGSDVSHSIYEKNSLNLEGHWTLTKNVHKLFFHSIESKSDHICGHLTSQDTQ